MTRASDAGHSALSPLVNKRQEESGLPAASRNRSRYVVCVVRATLGIAILLFHLPPALALEPVSGYYRSSFGQTVELNLQVAYPPPASLIIEQYFPGGLQIISAQPALRKFNSTRGKAKWLIKGIKPGAYIFTLQFDQPVQSSVFRAVIRYRAPLQGHFIEYRITP